MRVWESSEIFLLGGEVHGSHGSRIFRVLGSWGYRVGGLRVFGLGFSPHRVHRAAGWGDLGDLRGLGFRVWAL